MSHPTQAVTEAYSTSNPLRMLPRCLELVSAGAKEKWYKMKLPA